jgi:hypothetical protein
MADEPATIPNEAAAPETLQAPDNEPVPDAMNQGRRSFLDDDSLLRGVRNSYVICVVCLFLGVVSAVVILKRKKKEPEMTVKEEEPYEEPVQRNAAADDDATVLLKNYPGSQEYDHEQIPRGYERDRKCRDRPPDAGRR